MSALDLTDDDRFQCELCRAMQCWKEINFFAVDDLTSATPKLEVLPLGGQYPPAYARMICEACLGTICEVGMGRYWAPGPWPEPTE